MCIVMRCKVNCLNYEIKYIIFFYFFSWKFKDLTSYMCMYIYEMYII
jgi:hypothetical protein